MRQRSDRRNALVCLQVKGDKFREVLRDRCDSFVTNIVIVQIERSELAQVLRDRPCSSIAHIVVPQIERSELAQVLRDRPCFSIAHIVVAQIERGELAQVLRDRSSIRILQAERPQCEDLQLIESQQFAGQPEQNVGQLIHNTPLKLLGPVVRRCIKIDGWSNQNQLSRLPVVQLPQQIRQLVRRNPL